jgi:hypothetical protein
VPLPLPRRLIGSSLASSPGLDQLQHLGADTAGTTLTIKSSKNFLSGSFDISLFSCLLRFELKGLGLGLPFTAVHRRTLLWSSWPTGRRRGHPRLWGKLTHCGQGHGIEESKLRI